MGVSGRGVSAEGVGSVFRWYSVVSDRVGGNTLSINTLGQVIPPPLVTVGADYIYDATQDAVWVDPFGNQSPQPGTIAERTENATYPQKVTVSRTGTLFTTGAGTIAYDWTYGRQQQLLEQQVRNRVEHSSYNVADWVTGSNLDITPGQLSVVLGGNTSLFAEVTDTTSQQIFINLPEALPLSTEVTFSYWARSATGVADMSSGGYYDGGTSSVSITLDPIPADNVWRRYSYQITTTAAAVTTPELRIKGFANALIGDTFEMDGVQLEVGGVVTSLIITDGSSITRSADVDQLSDLFFALANGGQGSFLVTGIRDVDSQVANDWLFSIDDGTTDNRIQLRFETDNQARLLVSDGGVSTAAVNSVGTVLAGEPFALAVRWAENDFAMSLNGETVVVDNLGTIPATLTAAYLNSDRGNTAWPTHYNLFALSTALWSDAELETLSASMLSLVPAGLINTGFWNDSGTWNDDGVWVDSP